MTATIWKARCLCGLRSVLHFTGPGMNGTKLTCLQARVRHPYAVATAGPFAAMLRREAAINARYRRAS